MHSAVPELARFARAVVVGTGLIGASVAAAIKTRGLADEVIGCDGEQAQVALERGFIDRAEPDLARAIQAADLVVLAAPIAINCQLLAVLGEIASGRLARDALITDVSSTKQSVVAAAQKSLGMWWPHFVAAHPISGSERSGAAHARADLFDGHVAIVCPSPNNPPQAVSRIERLWADLGARVGQLDPKRHDELFGAVSHFPHLMAFALAGSIAAGELAADAQRYAGPGLRDTTRVAAASPDLWAGILMDNREATLAAARAFGAELARLEAVLRTGDRQALAQAIERGAAWRRALVVK